MQDDSNDKARRAAARYALEQTGGNDRPPIPEAEQERVLRDYEVEARADALSGAPAEKYGKIRERAVRKLMRSDPYLTDDGIDTVLRGLYGNASVTSAVLGGPIIDDEELSDVVEGLKAGSWLVRQTLIAQNKAARERAENEAFDSLSSQQRLNLWRAAKAEQD